MPKKAIKKKVKKDSSGSRRRFQTRSQRILKETHKKREERSTSGGMSIFAEEALPEYKPKQGTKESESNMIFIGAQGFEADTGIHFDASVHHGVGPALDRFLCMKVMKKQGCARCEDLAVRSQEWREAGGKKGEFPDALTALFPWDRAIYLVIDMANEDTMEEGWKLWNAPKGAVHAAVIAKTHNKMTGEFIDITDFKEGKIVTFDVGTRATKTGNYPEYLNFDLYDLEEAIPIHLQDALADIIEQGENNGGTVGQFLHWPTYDEVKKAHFAGVDRRGAPSGTDEEEDDIIDEDRIRTQLEDMNKIQLKRWAREKGIELNVAGKAEEDIIEEILEGMKGQVEETAEEEEDSPPDCFGEAYDHKECKDCDWLEDECVEETEKRLGDD